MESATLRPRWWFLATMAVGSLGVVVLVGLFIAVGPEVYFAVPVGTALGAWSAFKVQADQAGVTFQGRTSSWSDLELRRGRFGPSLRTRPELNRRRRETVSIHLPSLEADAESGYLMRLFNEASPGPSRGAE